MALSKKVTMNSTRMKGTRSSFIASSHASDSRLLLSHFLVHVNPAARSFSGRMLAMLADAHDAGRLTFFNAHARLADKTAFKRFIAPLRRIKWVVYCKAPFAGPKQVLRYLPRYTHRVAISNRRLVAADDAGVAFRLGRTLASTGRDAGRRCGFTRTSSSAAFSCTCCPKASTASAIIDQKPGLREETN